MTPPEATRVFLPPRGCCSGPTGRDAQALHTHNEDGGEAGVLTRLSLQSQQARADLYRSVQHLRLQREQLRTSLKHHTAGTHGVNKVTVLLLLLAYIKPYL